MDFESRLIPIMREGVEVVKMIFFRVMKENLVRKYPEQDITYNGRIAGAVLNELFGTPNNQEPFATFVQENKAVVFATLSAVPKELEKLRIPLTDALRVQFLCDSVEGNEDKAVLEKAEKIGVLLVDRDLPMPHHFMELVRRLGSSYDLLIKAMPKDLEPKGD